MTKNLQAISAELLANARLKRTPGRLALLELLLKEKKPLTKQEISAKLSGIAFNSVSIYRSLEAFLQAGIVHKIKVGDRNWRFAVCDCGSSRHCHPHFICRSCGTVECLQGLQIPKPQKLKPGYVAEEQEIYIRGLCAKCHLSEKYSC